MTDLELYYLLIKSMKLEIDFIKECDSKEVVTLPKELRVRDYLEGYLKGIKVTLAEAGRLINMEDIKYEEDN